jgi:hypothetical protein
MNNITGIVKDQIGMGRFATFALSNVSYYPLEHVQERIRFALYGDDGGQKMVDEQKDGLPYVHFPRPLAHTKTTGTFTLFIPTQGHPYGVMHIQRVEHKKRKDLNLSIISPIALAPHRINNITWGNECSFYGVDEEGSSWSIHCALPNK